MISRMFGYCVSLLALLMLITACGGGSTVAEGGIGGTGISYGKISGFGSVISNGVTFNTDDAIFSKDGTAAMQNDLRVGMVVSIQGEIDANGTTGTANSVTYFDLLEGPVEGAPGANSIVAMGQIIVVDGLTQYEGLSNISVLLDGDVVEVSGFYRTDGSILATYIESKGATTAHEIKGEITAIVPNTSISIGALTILNVGDTSSLNVGDLVEAEGTMNASDQLVATSVNLLNKGLELEDADDAELEGVATTTCGIAVPATLPCSFNLGFITVNVNASTQFEGGLLDAIQPGVRLEVEGELINGVIIAEEIEFEDGIELASTVVTVNAVTANTGTIVMEYGISDIIVTVDEFTDMSDFTPADLTAISAGDNIKIRAKDDGTIRAVRIEDNAGSDEIELQAPLEAENPNTDITLLNVNIVVTAPGFQFVDSRTDPETVLPDAATFFNLIAPGDLIKVNGTIDINDVITWDEAEIE